MKIPRLISNVTDRAYDYLSVGKEKVSTVGGKLINSAKKAKEAFEDEMEKEDGKTG